MGTKPRQPLSGWARLISDAKGWLAGWSTNPPSTDASGATQIAAYKAAFPSLGLLYVQMQYVAAPEPATGTTPATGAEFRLAGEPVPNYIAVALKGNPAAGVTVD